MIDLHSHSNVSDGDLTPAALVDLAAENGLTALALTDHDTTAGLDEAGNQAETLGLRLIRGVETEVEFRPGEFHLLGLGLENTGPGPLALFLEEIRRRRLDRNREMVGLMNRAGLDLTMEELGKLAGGEVIGRLHFARWLIDKGHCRNVPEVFERFIGPTGPFYVPKMRPSLEDALEAIHGAGGKAVLAHPLSLWISWGRMSAKLTEWSEMGLDGVEARHSGASKREAARFEELAAANGMFITGGSDFHGSGRPDRKLGYGAGGEKLAETLLEPFGE